jgi:hypothetical protein
MSTKWELTEDGERNRQKTAKRVVADFAHTLYPAITVDDLFVVWFCKTLDNWKAMISTNRVTGLYFEVTYNGRTNEIYLDYYVRERNLAIYMED